MGLFNTKNIEAFFDYIKDSSNSKGYIEDLCISHAIDLIAGTISTTDFQIMRYDKKLKKVKEVKDEIYYRLNIKPNINDNGVNFKRKLVMKLLTEGKALIIFEKKNKLKVDYQYLAKSYNCTDKILTGKKFSSVILEDDEGNEFQFNRDFDLTKCECIYFTFNNKNVSNKLQSYKKNISKTIEIANKAFKSSNVNKWRLKNPGTQARLKDFETGEDLDYSKYKEKITEGLMSDEESVILLSEIFDLVLLNKDKSKDSSDFLNIIKDTGDKIASAFKIPLDIFYGNKKEKSTGNNDFIMYACEPIMKCIEDTYTGNLINEEDFIKGEQIKFNRFMMQHIDIANLGTSLDKLTSIGFSFNQICKMLGLPETDEDWANEHHITKNYANVKGGVETDE